MKEDRFHLALHIKTRESDALESLLNVLCHGEPYQTYKVFSFMQHKGRMVSVPHDVYYNEHFRLAYMVKASYDLNTGDSLIFSTAYVNERDDLFLLRFATDIPIIRKKVSVRKHTR